MAVSGEKEELGSNHVLTSLFWHSDHRPKVRVKAGDGMGVLPHSCTHSLAG